MIYSMKIDIKDNRLGPILTVVNAKIMNSILILTVDHSNTEAKIPSDDINETVSKSFIYIVQQFIKNNDVDFKPNGDFDANELRTLIGKKSGWSFQIYGKEVEPIEYFIDNLK